MIFRRIVQMRLRVHTNMQSQLYRKDLKHIICCKLSKLESTISRCDISYRNCLKMCDFDSVPFRTKCRYPGRWGLLYERTISYWWWGKSAECRAGLQELVDNHWDELDGYHKAVEDRLCRLGCGPESQAFTYYHKSSHQYLRYKFPGSENIEKVIPRFIRTCLFFPF